MEFAARRARHGVPSSSAARIGASARSPPAITNSFGTRTTPAHPVQAAVAPCIPRPPLGRFVRRPIHLDHPLRLDAGEIDGKGADRHLPPEFGAELPPAQAAPQDFLGLRLPAPQPTGALQPMLRRPGRHGFRPAASRKWQVSEDRARLSPRAPSPARGRRWPCAAGSDEGVSERGPDRAALPAAPSSDLAPRGHLLPLGTGEGRASPLDRLPDGLALSTRAPSPASREKVALRSRVG